jgi:arylformamidase
VRSAARPGREVAAVRWYDATIPIHNELVGFPGDPPVRLHNDAASDPAFSLTHIDMSAHTGTHVDAPSHVIGGGAAVESLAIEALVGPAFVADATEISLCLDASALADLAIPAGCRRLILKTTNSRLWNRPAFDADFVSLTDDGARWLIEREVRLVGIDYLSISPAENPAPVHEALLAAGIVILEGLDLRDVPPGDATLLCLPLLLRGADGAPARVLIGRDDGDGPW